MDEIKNKDYEDSDKRKFIKKGFLALLAGVGAAILAKIPFVRGINYVRNTQVTEQVNVLGDLGGGTDDIDLTKGIVVTATVSTSAETFTFSNPPESGIDGSFTLILTDGGSQTVNWPASVSWMTSEAPTLVTSGVDILSFTTTDGGATWHGWVEGSTALGGDIGIFFGNNSNHINYINIASLGNASDFGDLPNSASSNAGCSSATRGLMGGGSDGGVINVISYIVIASLGDATDFGDLLTPEYHIGSLSNATRGLWAGDGDRSNIIQYVTIATTGNATNFGDLTTERNAMHEGLASTTRGIFAGGYGGGPYVDVMDYVTIASAGDATDFGNLSEGKEGLGSSSSSARGLFCGGYPDASLTNVIEYVTIATTGNVTDYGDLSVACTTSCTSSLTRATIGSVGNNNNVIEYVAIASTGNSSDFGDLVTGYNTSAVSNCHGGL